MQVKRTVHAERFTVIPHAISQHPTLTLAARGLLVLLLSLPNGFRIDCRKLADSLPGVGRRGVQKALDELETAGYYVRTTTRDERGRLRTTTAVYDTPQVVPIPGLPGTGEPNPGVSGTNPSKETPEKETSPLPPADAGSDPEHTTAQASSGLGEGETSTEDTANIGDDRQGGDEGPDDDGPKGGTVPAVEGITSLLGRIRQASGDRIAVPVRDAGKVLPLIRDWHAAGASDAQIIAAVCTDLPSVIRSATGFVLARLRDRLPVPSAVATSAPAVPLRDCEGACGRALRGGGMCRSCADSARPAEAAQKAPGRDLTALRRALADVQARAKHAA
ncbi:helix-turn-helix domain-containing protein [Nonomuraea wenchangensis]